MGRNDVASRVEKRPIGYTERNQIEDIKLCRFHRRKDIPVFLTFLTGTTYPYAGPTSETSRSFLPERMSINLRRVVNPYRPLFSNHSHGPDLLLILERRSVFIQEVCGSVSQEVSHLGLFPSVFRMGLSPKIVFFFCNFITRVTGFSTVTSTAAYRFIHNDKPYSCTNLVNAGT